MKKVVRHFYYLFALLFSKLVVLLPYRLAILCGGVLGGAAYRCIPETRRQTEEHLARAFPAWSTGEVRRAARDVFINQGKNLFELFSFPKLTAKDITDTIVTIERPECLTGALEGGRGVLIASAHCGNWEMMGAALALSGFPINVIARRIYIEGLNEMLVGFRRSKGMNVILRSGRESAKEILRALKHNETIALLIDQDTDVPGVFVDFFGRPAWTPSGLATLALRTGAAVVLALDVRLPGDRHRVLLTGPVEPAKSGNPERDVAEMTQRITRMIEEHVRAYPAQWVWMHRRWKTLNKAV